METELKFESIKELPPLVRGTRTASASVVAMREKVASKKPFKVPGDFDAKQLASLTQRIRTAADAVGLSVSIRTVDGLSFQGYEKEVDTEIAE